MPQNLIITGYTLEEMRNLQCCLHKLWHLKKVQSILFTAFKMSLFATSVVNNLVRNVNESLNGFCHIESDDGTIPRLSL